MTETKTTDKTSSDKKADKAAATPGGADKKAKESRDSAAKDPAKSYSRGENQKPVTERYRKNWDAIFGSKR